MRRKLPLIQAAANAIWALARLQPQRLPELTMREMGQLQSQEWANCFWTCKKMWVTEGVWRKFTENSSQPCIFDVEIQDLWRFRVFDEASWGVWALATAGIHDENFFKKAKARTESGGAVQISPSCSLNLLFYLFGSFWCVIEMPRSCFTQSKARNHFLVCVCSCTFDVWSQSPKIQEQLRPADAMKALASCSPNGSPSALASCRGIDISVERPHCLLRLEVLCWATWHGPMPLRQISWAGTVRGCDLSLGCLVWWSDGPLEHEGKPGKTVNFIEK